MNRNRKQYIDLGDLRDKACLVIPRNCQVGGTVLFWLRISDCEDHGIISSRDGSGRSGVAVECENGQYLV